jgi:hypothetical protein
MSCDEGRRRRGAFYIVGKGGKEEELGSVLLMTGTKASL